MTFRDCCILAYIIIVVFLQISQQSFPHYVCEIQGMAQGAGVPFEQMFLLNISPEAYALQSEIESRSQVTESTTIKPSADSCGCTTVLINNMNTKLHIHNEDSDSMVKPFGYLLSADIDEDGVKEQFTAFCYPGILPGRAFGFNMHGLTISVNSLSPLQVLRGSPSRLFLHRAVLGGRDVQDVCRILENGGLGAAYGFCTNLCTADKEMFSIELAPGQPKPHVHVHQVPEQKHCDTSSHYFHFNCYQHLKV